MNSWILTLADDLTGALEVGAQFAERNISSTVTTTSGETPVATAHVVDTETRHLTGCDAAVIVRQVAARLTLFNPDLVYKKTDSTLRGNIREEICALLDVFDGCHVFYAGAYPAMGRTVRDGELLIDGIPVHRTAFAMDALNPVRTSHIGKLLEGLPVTVFDSHTEDDLRDVVQQAMRSPSPVVLAGPASVAGALADLLPGAQQRTPALPRLRRCLVVNGSLHPKSIAQVEYGLSHGVFDSAWQLYRHPASDSGLARARAVGERVRDIINEGDIDGLIVFGGDTAFGINAALGSPSLRPLGEVLPGVSAATPSGSPQPTMITKAGGFGAVDVLCDLRRRLQ